MNQIELQAKCIEMLKTFNNTIVTSRLYPPEAPQVAQAVERGYTIITTFLKEHGVLQFSLSEDIPYLCCKRLEQEVLDSFPNLIVYRQLRHLQLENLVIDAQLDRFAFTQILSVFCASLEKIGKAGGGREYITGLGLASYFPDTLEVPGDGGAKPAEHSSARPRKKAKVPPELVACLLGRDERPEVAARLKQNIAQKKVWELVGATVSLILKDIQKKKKIAASPYFPMMLSRVEELLKQGDRLEDAAGGGVFLVENFNEPALLVLLAQQYPGSFGERVYQSLVNALSTDSLGRIIVLFREQLSRAKSSKRENPDRVKFISNVLVRLLNTNKGKHFLSQEKAKMVLIQGEKERKKQRLEAGFRRLLQGEAGLLESRELVDYLPKAVRLLFESSDREKVAHILDAMAKQLKFGRGDVQEHLLKSATAISEYLAGRGQWHLVDILVGPVIEKVAKIHDGDAHLEKALTLLETVMQHSWHGEENDRGDRIVALFHKIRSGQMKKAETVVSMVGMIQDKGIQRSSLPKLLEQCLEADDDEATCRRLVFQGPVAIRFLVDSLIGAEKGKDRMKIIDLLTSCDFFLPNVIHERLPAHMPWYGKRNLIKLLGESGGEADAEIVLPYLRHDDPRVQREAFLTIYKIGGKRRKPLLLAALEDTSESVMLQIIAGLAYFCDADVANRLSELLAAHNRFSEENRSDILGQLLDTLGRCRCPEALKGVESFLATKGRRGTAAITENIWLAAEQTCRVLENEIPEKGKTHLQATQIRSQALRQAAKWALKGGVEKRIITGLPQEQSIRNLLSQGDRSTAVDQLLQLIERTARMRNFRQADKLREWLVEIDETAFKEIIRAAEIIDREKAAAIDKSHLEQWSSLYDSLATEEFNAFYHVLLHKKYGDGDVVVNQGALQNALFFINSGKVKLYYVGQGDELLIHTLGQGQIFGTDVFFETSVWTMSVASVGPSEISILKLEKLQEKVEQFPELEEKLHGFCAQFESTEQIIQRSLTDRRMHKRHRISARVPTSLLVDGDRRSGVEAMVELQDISRGGVCYLARFSNRANARLLLGRRVALRLPAGPLSEGETVQATGDVLAVKAIRDIDGEYTVHLRFTELIEKNLLDKVIAAIGFDAQVT
ncbi:MAG: cyclic nucleotide-binding domain-containing protein [Desulforhopalus sp.]